MKKKKIIDVKMAETSTKLDALISRLKTSPEKRNYKNKGVYCLRIYMLDCSDELVFFVGRIILK